MNTKDLVNMLRSIDPSGKLPIVVGCAEGDLSYEAYNELEGELEEVVLRSVTIGEGEFAAYFDTPSPNKLGPLLSGRPFTAIHLRCRTVIERALLSGGGDVYDCVVS